MTSTKLTNTIRDSIVHKMMKYRFAKEATNLAIDLVEFSQRAYKDLYDAETLNKINALPDGWLPVNDEFMVKFGADVVQLETTTYNYYRPFSNDNVRRFADHKDAKLTNLIKNGKRRFLSKHNRSTGYGMNIIKQYEATHPLAAEFDRLARRVKDFETAADRARSSARSAVYSVTTTGKLITIWPEIEPFVNATVSPHSGAVALPAIPAAELNAAFNLPVSK